MADALWSADYVRIPVPPREFFTSEYYFGVMAKGLYPKWLEDLEEVLDPLNGIIEWLISGSLGTGKTTVACAATLYKIYELSCLINPHGYFDLMPTSPISFAMFSSDKYRAEGVGWTKLSNMINSSPYFREHFPVNKRRKSFDQTQQQEDSAIILPKNMRVVIGSKTRHALSEDIIGGILDEVNFREGKGGWDTEGINSALNMYNSVERRRKSRFEERGRVPGLLVLVSSCTATSSFLDIHIEKSRGNPQVKVSSYAVWDVKKPEKYSKKRFYVFIGESTGKHKIMSPEEATALGIKPTMKDDEVRRAFPAVLPVPEDFRAEFERDLPSAIQDIGGVSTGAFNYFVGNIQVVKDAMRSTRQHPFSGEKFAQFTTPQIRLGVKSNTTITDHLLLQHLVRKGLDGRFRPIHHPGASRAIHVDLSESIDATGISMECIPRLAVSVEQVGDQQIRSLLPVVWLDFALRIVAMKGDQIDFDKIVEFICLLRDGFGFPIRFVSFDSFQSTHALQLLMKSGFEVKKVSPDKTPDPYKQFLELCISRRMEMYNHDFLLWEIQHLIKDSSRKTIKIEHERDKGKDVADSVVCAAYRLLTEYAAGKISILQPTTARSVPKGAGLVRTVATETEDESWVTQGYKP